MSFTIDAVACDRNLLWSYNVLVFQPCWIHLLWQFLDCSTVYLSEMETKSCCLLLLLAYDYTIHLPFFLQPITPCAISSLCTTVHGFWRGFHLNMSIKENLKYKKNCLWVWNVWRMFKLFHALGWSLNDSWFGTYASQTLCASQFWALEPEILVSDKQTLFFRKSHIS